MLVTDPAIPEVTAIGSNLFDPVALGLVLTGTLLATAARAGLRDLGLAMRSALNLSQGRFDKHANRTAMARWARAVRQRGTLGAEERMPPDDDLARALMALIRTGSLNAMHSAHEETRTHRFRDQGRAARVFEQAGELAPVFGLVGTLFSMTQLAPTVGVHANAATLGAIATAVLSSLYGVLTAHFVCLPVAHAIARRTQEDDEAREDLVDWLANDIADAVPGVSVRRVSQLKSVT
ncbi:MAG: MotA/TolQ/ExbB proton channel family protein [Pseudomonadota bacterium]